MAYNRKWETESGRAIGMLAAVNYSNSYKTYLDMENSLYGPYDTNNDKYVYLRKATDNQYSNDVRLGALLNLTFQPRNSNHRYEFKNIFNQISKDRYSERTGFNAQPDNINNMEYYYSSRTTYNTQFTGRHNFDDSRFDWSVGYLTPTVTCRTVASLNVPTAPMKPWVFTVSAVNSPNWTNTSAQQI